MLADEIFLNGCVITMDPQNPEVSAFAIIGNRFSAVGSDAEISTWVGYGTKIFDLEKKTVVPGFIETHNHLSLYAMTLLQANCRTPPNGSIEDVKMTLKRMADTLEAGHWVRGWGYDDTLVSEKRHLTRDDLDEACPRNPVFVSHISGHLAYANSIALDLASITSRTPQPAGGEICRNVQGVPTGLLSEEGALRLVSQHIPSYTVTQLKAVFEEAVAQYHRAGITSIHDAAIGYFRHTPQVVHTYRELETERRLNLRVYMTILEEDYRDILKLGLGTGFGSDYLKLGGVKFFEDGSIQALTAALSEGYHNRPDVWGDLILSQETLNGLVETYFGAAIQIAIHANGDRAIETALRAVEKAHHLHPGRDHRTMIIHCQLASRDHIKRMKRIGVVPSYFVNHVYYWGDRHVAIFLGPERARRIDPLGSSVKEEMIFTLHSDLPVTPIDPLFSMYCAVNRITSTGHLLGPEERITPLEALKAYTTYAAFCSFEEKLKGSIEAGKLADFTILSDNPLTVSSDAIKDIQVRATVIGGEMVYHDI